MTSFKLNDSFSDILLTFSQQNYSLVDLPYNIFILNQCSTSPSDTPLRLSNFSN